MLGGASLCYADQQPVIGMSCKYDRWPRKRGKAGIGVLGMCLLLVYLENSIKTTMLIQILVKDGSLCLHITSFAQLYRKFFQFSVHPRETVVDRMKRLFIKPTYFPAKIDFYARFCVPMAFCVFNIAYWTTCFVMTSEYGPKNWFFQFCYWILETVQVTRSWSERILTIHANQESTNLIFMHFSPKKNGWFDISRPSFC